MTEKVSIIIPIYNVEKWLPDCIESAISQSYKNIEIILVDDGGVDKCPQICDDYAKIDNRIKVIHQKNKGRHGARNAGIKNATGEYIMFLDADDMLRHTTVETCVFYIKRNTVDGVAFRYERMDEQATVELIQKTKDTESLTDFNVEYCTGIDMLRKIWGTMQDKILSDSSINKLYKRELIAGLPFQANYYEDSMWIPDVYMKVKNWCILDKSLYLYRYRQGSAITTASLQRVRDSVIRCDYRRAVVKTLGDKEMIQKATREYLKGCCINQEDILKEWQDGDKLKKELRIWFKRDYKKYFYDLKVFDRCVFGLNYVWPTLFTKMLSVYNGKRKNYMCKVKRQ